MKKNIIQRKFFISILFFLVLSLFGLKASIASKYDPLLKVLIKKGIITKEEAIEIQKEAKELEEKERLEKFEKLKVDSTPKALKDLKFRMLTYFDYSIGEHASAHGKGTSYNEFAIKRGYFRVDKKINSWLAAHLTYDIHQDDDGDWKTRLKYLYAQLKPSDFGFLTHIKAEIGLGHIPWLDFEEHINPYRCQGTMAIERAGTFNSADLGINVRGYLGDELEDAAARTGNHHYAGRYGSWHIGVYNGSGYHSKEDNGNKVIEGRITLRPLPEILPGLQLSYFGLYGEGNRRAETSGEYPDYQVHLGFLSYEHPRIILTGQYFTTLGNKDGKWIDSKGNALWTEGYSIFFNLKPPVYSISNWLDRKFNVFFRYDHVDRDKNNKIADDAIYDLYIGGMAIEIIHGNYFLVDYEHTEFGDDFGNKHKDLPKINNKPGNERKVQFVYQLKF